MRRIRQILGPVDIFETDGRRLGMLVRQHEMAGDGSVRTGAAALVAGRFRVRLGRLMLSDSHLHFVAEGGDTLLALPLVDMAWIEVSPRARQLTLEVTMRGAVHHYVRVPSSDWVPLLRKAREVALVAPAVGMHQHPMLLAG